MSKSLVDIAKEYSRAWAEHDPDAIAAMHAAILCSICMTFAPRQPDVQPFAH